MKYNNSRLAQWTKALDLMQEVVGSNHGLARFFYNCFYKNRLQIPVQRKGKPLCRLQGNPVWNTGKPCWDYRETPV